jgi:hypothetical protein
MNVRRAQSTDADLVSDAGDLLMVLPLVPGGVG